MDRVFRHYTGRKGGSEFGWLGTGFFPSTRITGHTLLLGYLRSPWPGAQVSFDQQHVTTAEGAHVRFFDATTLQQVKQHKLTAPAESASYCAAKRKFVAGGEDMWVHLYDYDTGQVCIIHVCSRSFHAT